MNNFEEYLLHTLDGVQDSKVKEAMKYSLMASCIFDILHGADPINDGWEDGTGHSSFFLGILGQHQS